MKLKFWGAARTVTGSSHLLEFNGTRLLLDCGLFQGRRAETREFNKQFPADPASIHTVILSHAHLDHCGNLPQLVKHGFTGRIVCTAATADIARAIMYDSARIQESDAEYLNRKQKRTAGSSDINKSPIEPLYTTADVEETLPLLTSIFYDRPFHCADRKVEARFRDAGHILGSAFVEMRISDAGSEKTVLFSGDLGRPNRPILRDPDPPGPAETLILESTYGNRCHLDAADAEEHLCAALQKVLGRGGRVIIPAFSVERTQEVVYTLNRLWQTGRLQRVPVFVDSPLSANVTEIFRQHPDYFDNEAKAMMLHDRDPFGFEGLVYVREAAHSKRLNKLQTPCIIISASGMCEAGRVLHHLQNSLHDPRNAVLIVGFMAQNTLGRKLVDGHPEVRIFGDMVEVNAEIIVMNDFSGHADAEGLQKFAADIAAHGKLKRIFLVHGDEDAMDALCDSLREMLPGVEVHAPARGAEFEV